MTGKVTRSTRPGTPTAPSAAARERFRQYLDGALDPARLSTEQLQRHIDTNRQSAESFLAAFQASGDKYWLTNAAALHPDDPSVQFAMISHAADDNNRREWLDRFKNSDPENALANFLSARDHFQQGDPEGAVKDLLAGAAKPGFNDYTHHDIQSAEEMYLAAGESPIESKILANIQERLPHLQELRRLPQDLVKLQEAAGTRDDAQTYNDLAQIGVRLGESVGRSEGVQYLLNDLVGIAIQKQMLNTLQPDGRYPFLQSTPEQTLATLDARVRQIRAASQGGGDIANAAPNDIMAYFDRTKVHGELNALEWLAAKNTDAFP